MLRGFALLQILICGFTVTPAHAQDVITNPYPQSALACEDGTEITVPSFPVEDGEEQTLYLNYTQTDCSQERVELVLGYTQDCRGENNCMLGKFGRTQVDDLFRDHFKKALVQTHQTVTITDGVDGYFAPSECNTYCTPSQLTWFEGGYIYMLDSKIGGDAKEMMIDTARGYIKGLEK